MWRGRSRASRRRGGALPLRRPLRLRCCFRLRHGNLRHSRRRRRRRRRNVHADGRALRGSSADLAIPVSLLLELHFSLEIAHLGARRHYRCRRLNHCPPELYRLQPLQRWLARLVGATRRHHRRRCTPVHDERRVRRRSGKDLHRGALPRASARRHAAGHVCHR